MRRIKILIGVIILISLTACQELVASSTPDELPDTQSASIQKTPIIETSAVTIVTKIDPTVTSTPLMQTSPTEIGIVIQGNATEQVSTPTLLLTPTLHLTQVFATSGATLTPLPTISSDQLTSKTELLLANSMNCAKPCLWGAIPNQTTLDEVLNTLAPYQFRVSQVIDETGRRVSKYVDIGFDPEGNTVDQTVVFNFEDEVLVNILFRFAPAVDQILQKFGMPTEILILTFEKPDQVHPMYLNLYYFDLGFGITYRVPEVKVEGDLITGCFQNLEGYAQITVPKSLKSFEDLYISYRESYEIDKPIDEVTNLTNETFLEQFSDPDDPKCIETAAVNWK